MGNKAPTITKASGPGTISQSSSTFSWNGSDPDGTITKYEYRKDKGSWTSNGTSKSYTWSGYSEGSHTFEVRAQDNEGARSDIIGDVAWYYSNSGNETHEVGTKASNELGVYDMSGNVWEWCSDRYGSYSSSAQINPYDNSGSDRVDRGGSWYNASMNVRVANRDNFSPAGAGNYLGFRICRTVP